MACVYCGHRAGSRQPGRSRRNALLILEHVIPRSRGGDDSTANTAMACNRCNVHKGPLMLLEWTMLRAGLWLPGPKHSGRGPFRLDPRLDWGAPIDRRAQADGAP